MRKTWLPLLVALGIVVTAAVVLLSMGRNGICTCGEIKLFIPATDSSDTSQHIADPYTPTHLLHGLVFYFLLWLVARRIPVWWRFVAAVALESTWEVVENSDVIIDRYRQSALANDYVGDSVLNSMSDISSMAIGFALAAVLPWWVSVLLFLTVEAVLAYLIRDNLTLNIIELIHGVDAIEEWQQGKVTVPATRVPFSARPG